jgi:hypothetical protein
MRVILGRNPTEEHELRKFKKQSAKESIRNYERRVDCSLCNDALSVTHTACIASNEDVISEWWVGKDVDESTRGLILSPALSVGTEEKYLVRIAGLRTEIWTRDLQKIRNKSVNS